MVKKALSINEMGHRMNVECARWTVWKRKMSLICLVSALRSLF